MTSSNACDMLVEHCTGICNGTIDLEFEMALLICNCALYDQQQRMLIDLEFATALQDMPNKTAPRLTTASTQVLS